MARQVMTAAEAIKVQQLNIDTKESFVQHALTKDSYNGRLFRKELIEVAVAYAKQIYVRPDEADDRVTEAQVFIEQNLEDRLLQKVMQSAGINKTEAKNFLRLRDP